MTNAAAASTTNPTSAAPTAAHRAWIAAALLAALALRLWGVTAATLTQWDEGPYVSAAMDKGPAVREDPLVVYAPPLFPAACGALYRLFGEDPRVAVALAAVLGALSVLAAAALARALAGPAAGVAAAWFLALEPLSVEHSRLALTESTFTFLTLVALGFAVRCARAPNAAAAVGLGVAAGLATCTKFHGFLPIAAYAAGAAVDVLRADRRGPRIRAHARAALTAGLALLPFAALVMSEVLDHMSLAAFSESRKVWVDGFHLYTLRGTLEYALQATRALGAPGLAALGAVGLFVALRRIGRPDLAVLLVYAAILAVTLVTYRNYVRLLVPMMALLAVFGGALLAPLARSPRGRLAAAALLLAAATTGVRPLLEAVTFRGDGYPRMAAQVDAALAAAPGPAVAVAQQAIVPYLSRSSCDAVAWVTEPTGVRRLADGEFLYLVADQALARHGRVAPHLPAFEARLELVAEVANPLPPAVLFDRLQPARYLRFRDDPDREEFRDETRIRLYRLRAP